MRGRGVKVDVYAHMYQWRERVKLCICKGGRGVKYSMDPDSGLVDDDGYCYQPSKELPELKKAQRLMPASGLKGGRGVKLDIPVGNITVCTKGKFSLSYTRND